MLEKSIKNLMEIVSLSEDEVKANNKNVTAILDLEDLKSLKEVVEYMKQQNEDYTSVYLKGYYDGKRKAEMSQEDIKMSKECLAENALKENVKLKKELDNIKQKIKELIGKLHISDIEPWSTYKIPGDILFNMEQLSEERREDTIWKRKQN